MPSSAAKPSLTFFHSDDCERQAVAPIAEEAERRGYSVRFSPDLSERVEIGVYCQHACRPNADLSVIMLHDLAQRHDIWPAFWDHEPWDAFDIGLVPGEAWVQRWKSQAGQLGAAPRLGVFEIGWPKADLIYRSREQFHAQAEELRKSLGLIHPQTVLYAPSWENDGKQDDFVQSLVDLPVNLLLKQAPWSEAYPWVLENIREMDERHRGIAGNVHIIDRGVSIMYCIGVSDLLVSDESSVLIEASLHGVPSLSVTDWLIPDRQPPRPVCVPFENVQKTTRSALRESVEKLLADPVLARSEALGLRDHHFSHFGQSSKLAMDLIEAAWAKSPLPFAPLQTPPAVLDQRLYRQAERCLTNDDISGATSILARLIAKDSDCWQAFNDMGGICFNQRDIEGALTLLKRAVEKEGRPGLAMRNLAATQLSAGLWDDALLSYARLLHELPDDQQSRENLAGLLAGEFDLSQTACEEMLKVLCSGER